MRKFHNQFTLPGLLNKKKSLLMNFLPNSIIFFNYVSSIVQENVGVFLNECKNVMRKFLLRKRNISERDGFGLRGTKGKSSIL